MRESGLTWSIFRFSDVPVMGLRAPHRIMFDIPLAQRFEVLHTADAGLAVPGCSASMPRGTRSCWLAAARCQVTYGEFFFGLLGAMGMGALPADAFTTRPYCTDWLDTAESQALLRLSAAQLRRHRRGDPGPRRLAPARDPAAAAADPSRDPPAVPVPHGREGVRLTTGSVSPRPGLVVRYGGWWATSWAHTLARSAAVAVRAVQGPGAGRAAPVTSGCATRLRYQAGDRSAPLFDATTRRSRPWAR